MQHQVLEPVDQSQSQSQSQSLGVLEQLSVEPLSVARWAMDRSSVTVVRVTERLSVLVSEGPGHPESPSFYAEQGPIVCALPDSVVFWDLSGLLSTDLGVVRTCLGVGKDHRHKIAQVHMFYRSPLIGMAVTVANVALGGLIQLYREVDPFYESLRTATLDHGSRTDD